MIALTEVIPLSLTWLAIGVLPDIARCFFKSNTQAVKLCVSEPFDFMVPFVTLALATIGAMASFGFHPGCCVCFISFWLLYVTNVLLGKQCTNYSTQKTITRLLGSLRLLTRIRMAKFMPPHIQTTRTSLSGLSPEIAHWCYTPSPLSFYVHST